MKWLPIVVFVILVPILIIIANFVIVLYDSPWYHEQFRQMGVYERNQDANALLENLQHFFSGDGELSSNLTAEEQSHMRDVRSVIRFAYVLLYITAIASILLLFYISKRGAKKVLLTVVYGALATLVALVVLILLTLNFSASFVQFHTLFFQQGTWQFSEDSLLIRTFPEQFFFAFFRTVIVNSAITALFLLVLMLLAFLYTNYYVKNRAF